MKLKNEDEAGEKLIEENDKQNVKPSSNEEESQNKNMLTYFVYFILFSIVLGIIVLIITLAIDKNAFSSSGNYLISDTAIMKPKSDFRKFRTILLKNGLEAVIISDPVSITSGASLSVRVGANSDPNELLGLAHFCEHMLFLGSTKYPNGDDYFKTVSENNGHFNAYTDREITNYFFDIHYYSFDKALDIFSRFFIDPLFNEEKMNKEINSVNSEFEKNLIIDSRKRSQVYAHLSDQKVPFHRFTTGNIETLVKNAEKLGISLREEMIKFHNTFYVADQMKLIIYSNEDVDDLQEMIAEKFSDIKSSKGFEDKENHSENGYDQKPINNTDKKSKKILTYSRKQLHYNEERFLQRESLKINNSTGDANFTHKVEVNNKTEEELEKEEDDEEKEENKNLNLNSTIVNNNTDDSTAASPSNNEIKSNKTNTKIETKTPSTIQDKILSFPYYHSNLGSLIKFAAITLEHEMTIHFIQKALTDSAYFSYNPYYYFQYIFESKDKYSLAEILKKKGLATKLSSANDRDYTEWSDFTITINLTKDGITKLQEVLQIIKSYLKYMKEVLINKNYYNYLKKVSRLNFEYKSFHNSGNNNLLYKKISEIGARTQRYPLQYILDETHLINNYNETVLREYAEGLVLEKSIIFIPDKFTKDIEYEFLIKESEKNDYEPWYRTNFTFYKIDFSKLKDTKLKIKKKLSLIDEKFIDPLINNITTCNSRCLEKLKTFSTSEPSLLNKTNMFEFWYKFENTLNFKKTSVELFLKYDKFEKEEDRIHILILETFLKRRLKKLNSRLKFFTNSITVTHDVLGIKISFTTFNENIKDVTKDLVDQLHIVYSKEKMKNFDMVITEVKDYLIKEYNAQPYSLSYEYLKKNVLSKYMTSEELLNILSKVTQDDFVDFIYHKFHKNYYVKLLILGDIQESTARDLFTEFNPMLKLDSVKENKNFVYSLKEKRKNRRVTLKNFSGNYLLRKEYHQETNKNNVLLKCNEIGKANFKNELRINLFNSIIGNIVFRELRINKQFGYVAKSKIETFENYLFYCIYVQGSSKLPHTMDEAAVDLVENTIKEKLEKLTEKEFNSAKRKNFDTIADSRLDLTQASKRYFTEIKENTYKFNNFQIIEKYSKGLKKEDLVSFFKERFLDKDTLRFTVYMYSKQVPRDKMKLKAEVHSSYEEVKDS